MQAALIIMTILGCDDSVSSCHYVATAEQRWPTISLCETASESALTARADSSNYPVLIAVCQTLEDAALAQGPALPAERPALEPQESAAAVPVAHDEAGLAARALDRVKQMVPSTEGIRTLAAKPVHAVADGYSWVAKAFGR